MKKEYSVVVGLIAILVIIMVVISFRDSGVYQGKFGEVEVEEIDLSSRVPSRIAKIHVKLGQRVKAGDILVELEDDIIAAQKQKAEAAVNAAESQQAISRDATRTEDLIQLKANLSAAEKQRDFANSTREKMRQLYKDGAIAELKLEEVETTAYAAEEKHRAAVAQYQLGRKGARDESKKSADALVSQAKSGLLEVSAYEKDLTIKAPVDGEIVSIPHNEGELAPQGYPIITMINTGESWITLQVTENELANLPLGKEVQFSIPALGNKKMSAKVSYISALPSYATLIYTKQKSSFDLKTFEIRLTPITPPENFRPGMTVLIAD